jgi:hypothetical protein
LEKRVENGRVAVLAKGVFLVPRQDDRKELCRRMSLAILVLYLEIEVVDLSVIGSHFFEGDELAMKGDGVTIPAMKNVV